MECRNSRANFQLSEIAKILVYSNYWNSVQPVSILQFRSEKFISVVISEFTLGRLHTHFHTTS